MDIPLTPNPSVEPPQMPITESGSFQQILETITDIIFKMDAEGRFIYVTPSITPLLGYAPADLMGQYFSDVVSPLRRAEVKAFYAEQLQKHVSDTRHEIPLISQTGEERWMQLSVRLLTEGDQVTGFLGVGRDITEHKRMETELRRREAQLAEAQQLAQIGSWDWDISANTVAWSDELYRIYGLLPSEFEASYEGYLQRVHPHDRARVDQIITVAYEQHQAFQYEHRIVRPDGSVGVLQSRGRVIVNSDDKPVRMIGTAQDITERKQAEEALRESEVRYRLVFEGASIGMAILDRWGCAVTANSKFESMIGYNADELREMPFSAYTHPDDLGPNLAFFKQLLAGEIDQYHMEKRYLHKNGNVVWVRMNVSLFLGSMEAPLILAMAENITERKRAEEAVAEERDLLRTLIDTSPDYIFIKDREGRFIVSNIAHAQAVAASPEQLVGKTAFELFPPELAAQFHADDQAVLASGKSLLNLERQTIDKKGRPRWVLTTKVILHNRHGEISGLIGMSRDITARKQVEAQAIELGVEKGKVRLITDFIQNASHDLKTPLSVVNTSVYLAGKTPDPEVRQRHLREIENQIHDLSRIIEELLAMSNLDARTEFEIAPVDLNEVVDHAVKNITRRAAEKNLTVTCTLDSSDLIIHADERHLAHALNRLLDNAILYTPSGGDIDVATRRQAQGVEVDVRDTGIGIGDADLPFIFERFYKTNRARTYDKSGAGLGLSIVRKIVELHHGEIAVESQPGHGSTFRLTLPIRQDSYDQMLDSM
jgi:PAS domain S-box-containing protein